MDCTVLQPESQYQPIVAQCPPGLWRAEPATYPSSQAVAGPEDIQINGSIRKSGHTGLRC